MGFSSGTSTRWLFVHCFQVELEFGVLVFVEGEKNGESGENPSEQEREPTTNSTHM